MTNTRLQTAYIAGKITGAKNQNKPMFDRAEACLRYVHVYGRVINPHALCADMSQSLPWHKFMRKCIKAVADSDIVYVLPMWSVSRGARWEARTARKLNIQIIDYRTMKNLPEWKYFVLMLVGFVPAQYTSFKARLNASNTISK